MSTNITDALADIDVVFAEWIEKLRKQATPLCRLAEVLAADPQWTLDMPQVDAAVAAGKVAEDHARKAEDRLHAWRRSLIAPGAQIENLTPLLDILATLKVGKESLEVAMVTLGRLGRG